MKCRLLIFALLLPLLATAQVKVIENPDYSCKYTSLETITKIELHDTVTKVHVHVTFLPNWWVYYDTLSYIQPAGTQERYHLIRVENLSPDEQEFLIIDFKKRLSNPFMKEYPAQVR